jgi:uncharacterized protein (DUF362 family)
VSRAGVTRREFMRLAGASALAAWPVAAATGGQAPTVNPPGRLYRVALVPCPDYGPETLAAAIKAGWRTSSPPDVRGKRVVVKPNMVDVSPDRPIHTDPRLVEALIVHLGDLGAREIILAEGTSHNRDAEDLFRRSGYEALAKRRGVRLMDLNYDDLTIVKSVNPRATLLRNMALPRTVAEAEVLISVPKMKTHKLAGITLSLKNMFGLLPGMVYGWPKNTLHWNGIPLSICEINATVRTHYAVVDGVIGMEGHGPIMGSARKAGVLVMGDNALAVDATAARIMGVDPVRVDYLAMAQRLGLGSLKQDELRIEGGKIEPLRRLFALDPEFRSLRASNDPT